MKSISLYCTEGSSNKEYHVDLVAKDAGYVVNFRYGPRGKALTAGTKTNAPVDLAAATKIYNKLVSEKTAKGYTPDVSGVAYTDTPDQGRVSGWRPALLTPIDEVGLAERLASDLWVASEKIDGERRAVEVTADGLKGMNRKGLYVPIPETWGAILGQLPHGTILDGEHVGDTIHVFDCVRLGEHDMKHIGYADRVKLLQAHMTGVVMPVMASGIDPKYLNAVSMVHVATDLNSKTNLLYRVQLRGGEGLVLRLAAGPYEAGVTPGSAKYKFLESSTCIVSQVNGNKRSVALSLLDANGAEVPVGNVTIPANHAIPEPGALVEVRYMHMFEAGSLYQPTYQGVRTDLDREAAVLSQVTRIRTKGGEAIDDEPEAAELRRERGG